MQDITASEVKERLDKGEMVHLIDVREEHEYEEYNIGAILIPLGTLPDRLSELEEWKNEEIVVHCRSGARSANAKQYLASQGFTNVRNMLGGVIAYKAL
ncbi:MAG: rhodanese-like domain-containing protein [Bacteroidetes bacterium]|nr:MAG: rhodanese-like domain-containing protein [Bacteroidota bacterium]